MTTSFVFVLSLLDTRRVSFSCLSVLNRQNQTQAYMCNREASISKVSSDPEMDKMEKKTPFRKDEKLHLKNHK